MNHRDDSAPPPSPARRRRKWPWVVGFVLLLLISVGSYWFQLHSAAEKGWRAAVAEAEQDDPNWRWEEMQARRRTWKDEENGALVMRAASGLTPVRWPAWDHTQGAQPGPGDGGAAEGGQSAKLFRSEAERVAFQEGLSNLELQVQLDANQLAALREEMKRAEKAVAEARRLVDFPGGRFPIQYTTDFFSTVMDEVQLARGVANLLGYDMLLRAQDQDLAGALRSCHALLHLCRYFDEEPPLIAMLVRVAIRSVALRRLERILAQGEPEAADLARLQKVLEEEEAFPVLLRALRGERAGNDQMAKAMESGQVGWAQLGAPGSPVESLKMLLPSALRGQRAAVLRVNNRLIELAKLPPDKRQAEEAKLTKEIDTMPTLARLLVPAHLKVSSAATRTQADLRCALVMLAAERYRRTHQRWPETAAALVPDFLTRVPEDPFDGKPLRFQRVSDGLVIYSVGLDGTDGGGKLGKNPNDKGTDLGFRLWDVKHRRQPPKPQPPSAAPAPPP